jgi:hypothetical protein
MVNLDEGGLQVGSVSGRNIRAGSRCQPDGVALDSIPAGRGFDCGWTGQPFGRAMAGWSKPGRWP